MHQRKEEPIRRIPLLFDFVKAIHEHTNKEVCVDVINMITVARYANN